VKNKIKDKIKRKEINKFEKKQKEVIFNFNERQTKCATSGNIQIDEEYNECLIDSGAFTSFISESYCNSRDFKKEKIENKKNWVTANGTPIHVDGQVKIKVKIDKKEFFARFVVAKELSQDVILGVDILKPNGCIIDFANNKLLCGDSSVDLKTISPIKPFYAHSTDTIEINPFSQELMWISINKPVKVFHVGPAGKSQVAEMLTEKDEKNRIPIMVQNPTSTPKKVRRGDIIATISQVEIIKSIENDKEWVKFLKNENFQKEVVNEISEANKSKKWKPSSRIKFTNSALNNDQKDKLRELIDEYWMVFSRNDEDIGKLSDKYGTHDIKLTDETGIHQRAYRTPQAKESIINESIGKMLKMHVIEPSESDWASPIVLVKKSDGSERFCVDYRKLNAVTIKDSYPMPNIESKLNKLHGSKYFTSLDCTSGYWQIQLSERAKKLVAFTASQGLFTFNVMPFGLCNAGATFQRIIEKIIKGLNNSTAYIDDLLTYSQEFELHLQHLRVLFERLKSVNVKVKTNKCKIACNELMFLGYKISEKGISMDESRIAAVQKYPRPTKSKHIQQFLGLVGFYRQFIRNFADITEPLNRLTRKNAKFIWSHDCEYAFQSLIKQLSERPILAYPDFNKPFCLATDASQVGIGAVLGQVDDKGRETAIHFASRSLSQAERNYSTIERELLAIIYAVDKFRYYLYGKKFKIITDHNPLVYLNNITLSSERLTRWRLRLSEYDFEIEYRKGKANGNADSMSRIEIDDSNEPLKDNLEQIFSIHQEEGNIISKHEILENLNSIYAERVNLESLKESIDRSPVDTAMVVCIPEKFQELRGISDELTNKYGDISSLKRQKLKVGTCLVWQGKRALLYLITRKHESNKSSYEMFNTCLKHLSDRCQELKINKLGFPKYSAGLDKLKWNQVEESIDKILVKKGFECKVYLGNKESTDIEQEDLDMNCKIKKMQKQDKEIRKLVSETMLNHNKGFVIENGILFKIRKGRHQKIFKQLVVPEALKEDVLKVCHDNFTGAHLGEKKTWVKLNNRFYWKDAYKQTINYVRSCNVCSCLKNPPTTRAYLKPIVDFQNPFDKIGVDILELSRSNTGNKYVVVFTDYLTKWVEAFPMTNMRADTIAKIFVNEIISRHAAPKELLSDQGANFLSNLVKEVCNYFKVKKINTAPYNPKCDGLVERFNKTLCKMLAAYSDSNQSNWDLYLPLVLLAYRTSEQSTTNNSPFELLYGREARLPTDLDFNNNYCVSPFIESIQYGWKEAKRQIEIQAKLNKERYDSKYVKPPVEYKVGDEIRVKQPQTKVGLKKKLRNDHWGPPRKIIGVSPENLKLDNKKIVNVNNVKLKEIDREFIRKDPQTTRYGRQTRPRYKNDIYNLN
jgi:predicted aspartyl protease